MELNSDDILEILADKEITELHHANTVRTACTFLRHAHLMSRGNIEEANLPQTSQQTDEVDMKYGLWYDVFLDGIDIHSRAKQRNFYGPVVFVFDVQLFAEEWLSSVWVTKKNPQNWVDDEPLSERYFQTTEEFRDGYRKGNFDKTFVLRHVGGLLRLSPHLKRIELDNPEVELDGLDSYSMAAGGLIASARAGGLENPSIRKRKCSRICRCVDQYEAMSYEFFRKFFFP